MLGQFEAARYAMRVGIDVAHERSWGLARTLRTGLAKIPRVRTLDRGSSPCAIVTASIDGAHGRELAAALAKDRINSVVTLREFGQLDFAEKGVESAVRLSPHYYNTEDEVAATIAAVEKFVRGL